MSSWQEYGHIEEGEIFIKAFGDYPERKLGDAKEDEEKSIQHYVDRYQIILDRVNKFLTKIEEAQNKGSFLSGLTSLKDKVANFSALGDLKTLVERVEKEEKELEKEVELNKVKNKESRLKLLEELKLLKDDSDWLTTTPKVKEIQQSWIKVGKTTAEEEEILQKEFKEIIDLYFSRKKEFDADRREMEQSNVQSYKEVIEEAKKLAESNDPILKSKIDELHKRWKAIGNVSKKYSQDLWLSFKQYSDQIFEKINSQEKKKKSTQNQSSKIVPSHYKEDLFSQIDEIENLESKLALKLAKELKGQWKKAKFRNAEQQDFDQSTFYQKIDMILEKNFLVEQTKKRNQNFDSLTEDQQKEVLCKQLQRFIKKDKETIGLYNNNVALTSERTNDSWEKLVQQKVVAQQRKLKAKESLLKQLQ